MGGNIHSLLWNILNVEELTMNPIMFLVLSFSGGIAGQLLLKNGMNKVGKISLLEENIFKNIWKMFTNLSVTIGTIIFGFSIVLWLFALSGLDLSYAYPLVSINYVVIALLSKMFFKEKINLMRWVSIFIICFGVVLVSIT